jgi:hypothetical protein
MRIKLNFNNFVVTGLIAFGLTGCFWNPPELANMKVCETLETTGNCQVDTNAFQNKKQKFFVSADSKNFKSDTRVKVVFTFLPTEGPLPNKEVPLTSNSVETRNSDKFVVTSLTPPSAGWQSGKYRVELMLTSDKKYNREFVITP